MSANTRLASTKLVVHDLETTARFYCDAYGYEQTGRIQVAIGDEAARSDPRWAPQILTAGLGYLPTAATPDTDLTERIASALDRAGVG